MDANHQNGTGNNLSTTENKIWLPPSYTNNKTSKDKEQISKRQHPNTDDPEAWKTYWKAQGLLWRTEPEIDAERQKYLAERRSISPNVEKGIYPFGGIKLSRADVEWLLVTHENGHGPIIWNDESQRHREGVDLRGADLRNLNLKYLPLSKMLGGMHWNRIE